MKQVGIRKKFNINKNIHNCFFSDELYFKNKIHFIFNRKTYAVTEIEIEENSELDAYVKSENYVILPRFWSEGRYSDMVKEINSREVTEFFNIPKDNWEELGFRYRCFIDWNGLEHIELHKHELFMQHELIQWCQKNNIRYSTKKIKEPKIYVNDYSKLKNIKWITDGH